VVLTEHALLLLEVLTGCLYPWSSESFAEMRTMLAGAATPESEWELRPVLPRSLTGPYLAQIIELVLHYATRLTPAASQDIRRVSCQCLQVLSLLVDVLRHCPPPTPHDPTQGPSAAPVLVQVPTGTNQDPSVWRTYFPGVYSALASLAMDKTRQRGSRLQTLALVRILDLATAVMADRVNSSTIRSSMVGTASVSESVAAALPGDQMHHFDLLLSKVGVSGGRSSADRLSGRSAVAPAERPVAGSAVQGQLKLPELTGVSLSWRTDLLQRLSAHFPVVFRHALCTVNDKHRAVLVQRLCLFTGECKEFLGTNGLAFVLPLLLFGFADTAGPGSGVETGISAALGGECVAVLASGPTLLLEDIFNGAVTISCERVVVSSGSGSDGDVLLGDATVASSTAPGGGRDGPSSSTGSLGGRVLWEQTVKSILVSTLATCTQQLMELISDSAGPKIGGSRGGGAGDSESALRMTLGAALGCFFLLGRNAVRSLFEQSNVSSPHSSAGSVDTAAAGGDRTAALGKKFVYMLTCLLTPVGAGGVTAGSLGSTVTLLEERNYCAISHFKEGASLSPMFSTVTTGYHRLSWEHVTDAESRALVRRLCFFLGKHQLLGFLLAVVRPMESCVHAVLRKLTKAVSSSGRDSDPAGGSKRTRKAKDKTNGKTKDKAHLVSSTVDGTIVSASANADDAANAAAALSIRVQSWSQSISVWRLIGFAVLGTCCCRYEKLSPQSSLTALQGETVPNHSPVQAHRSATKRPQCAVCLRVESPAEKGKNPSPLSRCTRCKSVFYCCRDHQAKDWASHKLVCQQSAATPAATASATATPAPSVSASTPANGVGVAGSLFLEHHLVDPETLLVSPTVQRCVCAELHGSALIEDTNANINARRDSAAAVPSTKAPFLVSAVAGGTDASSVEGAVGAAIELCVAELKRYLEFSVLTVIRNEAAVIESTVLVHSRAHAGFGFNGSGVAIEGPHFHSQSPVLEGGMSPLEQSLMSVRVSRVLECLGHCCFVLHQGFRRHLLGTLYTLLELSVDTSFVVKQAAESTLRRIALYCGYASVKELYRDNLDYIVDPLCASLRRNQTHVDPMADVDHIFTNSVMLSKLAGRGNEYGSGAVKGKSSLGKRASSFQYSSYRAPAIVDLVFGHFGQEAYALEKDNASDIPVDLGPSSATGVPSVSGEGGDGAVSLVLLRDMVGDIMATLDSLASTQALRQEQVRSLLRVLQIISDRAVQIPIPGAAGFSGNSREPLEGAESEFDSLGAVVRSYAAYLTTLDSLELPGATFADPDADIARRRTELRREAESASAAASGIKEEDPLEDVDLDALRRRSPGLVLLLDVLKRSAYFVASGQLDAQIVVVKTMRICIERLASSPRLFLPAVHQAWSPLMSRVKEQLAVVQYYYNRLGPVSALQAGSGSVPVGGRGVGGTERVLSAFNTGVGSSASPTKDELRGVERVRDSSLLRLETAPSSSPATASALLACAVTSGSNGSGSEASRRQADDALVSNPMFLKRKLHLFPELLALLGSVAALSTDFVAAKMEDDFLPLLLDVLLCMSREALHRLEQRGPVSQTESSPQAQSNTKSGGGSSSSSSSSGSTVECRVKLAIVSFLQRCVGVIGCQSFIAKVIPGCCVLLLPFLSSLEPAELRDRTCELYCAFYTVNPSGVAALLSPVLKEHSHCCGADGQAQTGGSGGSCGRGDWLAAVADPRVHPIVRGMFVRTANAANHNALQRIRQSYTSQRPAMLLEDLAGLSTSRDNTGKTRGSAVAFKIGCFGGLDVFPSDRITDLVAASFTHMLGHLASNAGVVEYVLKIRGGNGNDCTTGACPDSGHNGEPSPIRMNALWKKSILRNTHM